MKDIVEDINKWQAIPCSWIKKYYKHVNSHKEIPILKKVDKLILTFIWKKIIIIFYEKKDWEEIALSRY